MMPSEQNLSKNIKNTNYPDTCSHTLTVSTSFTNKNEYLDKNYVCTLAASTIRDVASASILAAARSFFCCSESDCDSASILSALTNWDVAYEQTEICNKIYSSNAVETFVFEFMICHNRNGRSITHTDKRTNVVTNNQQSPILFFYFM